MSVPSVWPYYTHIVVCHLTWKMISLNILQSLWASSYALLLLSWKTPCSKKWNIFSSENMLQAASSLFHNWESLKHRDLSLYNIPWNCAVQHWRPCSHIRAGQKCPEGAPKQSSHQTWVFPEPTELWCSSQRPRHSQGEGQPHTEVSFP